MLEKLRNSIRHEEGATAVEYGIMVALIAAIIVLVVVLLGRQVKSGFRDTSSGLTTGNITATSPTATDC